MFWRLDSIVMKRKKFIICSTEPRKSLSEIPTINDHAGSSMFKDDVDRRENPEEDGDSLAMKTMLTRLSKGEQTTNTIMKIIMVVRQGKKNLTK